jgi:hypothetical protein
LNDKLQTALQALIGLPLWSAGRAVNLIWLQFGNKHRVTNRFGEPKTKTVGDYALHLQMPWRMTQEGKVLVGFQDLFAPAVRASRSSFDWRIPGATRCDRRLKAQFGRNKQPWIVQRVEADSLGGIRMSFENGAVLETFSATTTQGEIWRLFQPYTEAPHTVVRSDDRGAVFIER